MICLLWSGISFSTAVTVVVAKLVTSFILALRVVVVIVAVVVVVVVVVVAKLVISDILFSISLILVYFNQQEQVLIYQYLIYLLYFWNCFNELVLFSNLSVSNLSTSDFKLLANFEVTTTVAFFKFGFEKHLLIHTKPFLSMQLLKELS